MCINTKLDTRITIDVTQIECISESTYLGSIIRIALGTHSDIKNRLAKAKITLMYGSECWGMYESDRTSLNTFHTGSQRRIQ
ncbi:hypothetical protein BpHYR1_049942 [Brachionus plicatilis]|uniref:Uncharacterized protein n=1 Tax=Brachionus plicatilis TaxID=10195 RepID=A0A3M7RWL8_BRAPC|nr:hypothetical protein BpHYR1_049942 [Brachionus plicatilis]